MNEKLINTARECVDNLPDPPDGLLVFGVSVDNYDAPQLCKIIALMAQQATVEAKLNANSMRLMSDLAHHARKL